MFQKFSKHSVTALLTAALLAVNILSPFQAFATEGDSAAEPAQTAAAEAPASTETAGPTDGELAKIRESDNLTEAFSSLPVDNTTLPEGYEEVAASEAVTLYANRATGEIALKNNANGFLWRSTPYQATQDAIAAANGKAATNLQSQFFLTYTKGFSQYDVNSKVDCADKGNMTAETIENGIKFVYRFPQEKTSTNTDFRDIFSGGKKNNEESTDSSEPANAFVVPVSYTIEGDQLVAKLLLTDPEACLAYTNREKVTISFATTSTQVERDVAYNVTEIAFLPYFGAAGANEEGYMIIPDGSGAKVNFNNGKNLTDPYRAPIYGTYVDTKADYSKLNDNVRMPIIGIVRQGEAEANALLGIVTENEAVGIVNAKVSGDDTSYNSVYTTVLNKIIQSGVGTDIAMPMAPSMLGQNKDYTVAYIPVAGEEATYAGLAQRYQQYLVDEKGLTKADDMNETALTLDMYAGVELETSVWGVPTKIFDPMTTTEDLKTLVADMQENNITDLVVKYSDWISHGQRGKVPTKVKAESKIGGNGKFKKLFTYMEENSVDFYPNVDFINYSENGNGVSGFFDCAKYADMTPAYQLETTNSHINLGKRWYLLKPDIVPEVAEKFMKAYGKMDATGISLESIGSTVYSDGTGGGVKRGDTLYVWDEVIKSFKDAGQKIMMTEANAYTFPYADVILSAPTNETYAEIADEAIPFYQIALRGYIPYSSEAINLASDTDRALLKAVETGSSLTYSFVMRDPSSLKETYLNYLYSCDYSLWRDDVMAAYQQYKPIMERVAGQEIINHETVARDVYKTTYANGVQVVVNYNGTDVAVDGQTVPAMGYIQLGGM